jgi:UDP-4-amino-4,6-dideoxy-N-acetyl-beta-L-altrosamine N-acetyltransferase
MFYQEDKMLAENNISLRAVRNSDKDFLYEMINDPELVQFNAPYRPVHELNHQHWYESIIKDKTKELFIIENDSVAIGSVQLFDINLVHRTAELAIRIRNNADRGRGAGSTAIDLLTQHAYRNLGLIRVWLRVLKNNERAIKAYEKAGFIQEGVMRMAAFINGKHQDMLIMSKINEELIGR